jgi:glucans biosynthesis protein C
MAGFEVIIYGRIWVITEVQRLVLDRPIHAGIKFLFVFLMTTLLSWLTAQMVFRIPKLKTIL